MNCILLEPEEMTAARAELRGRRALHVVKVWHSQPGQTVRVGVRGGRLGQATIASISDDVIELTSIELDTDAPPALPLTLCVALPRPKSLRRVLHAATTLGVKRIVLIESWRV